VTGIDELDEDVGEPLGRLHLVDRERVVRAPNSSMIIFRAYAANAAISGTWA
jgi:hypothetical protein